MHASDECDSSVMVITASVDTETARLFLPRQEKFSSSRTAKEGGSQYKRGKETYNYEKIQIDR